MKLDLSLYLVTDPRFATDSSLESKVLSAVEGGVTIVQLRDKTATADSLAWTAERLLKILEPYRVPLIINDHVSVARKVGAHGVHVGQSDMRPERARELLGPTSIIGLSIESLSDLEHVPNDIDYLAASPVFATPTKLDTAQPFGIDGLRQLRARCTKPLIAIGGISTINLKTVLEQGVDGVAIVSSILNTDDPKQAARAFKKIIHTFRERCDAHA